ncbi:MAG: hypothetical protein QME40_07805 [bacterium]|nr:hypothetical protein [bacterium]
MEIRQIKVKSYSGYKANERPTSFIFRDRHYIIDKIEKMWYEENIDTSQGRKRFFQVKSNDDTTYVICYDESTDQWLLKK